MQGLLGLLAEGTQPCELALPAHLAVQYDHMLRVSTEPRLHGFADGAQLVQRGRVQLRPAKVLDLRGAGVGLGLVATKEEVGGGGRGTGCRDLETRSGACWLCPWQLQHFPHLDNGLIPDAPCFGVSQVACHMGKCFRVK